MDVQQRYWQEFIELKRDARYIDLCQARTERIDWLISVLTAVTSSSSIAGWALWQQLSFVWAFLIAASQLFQAIKEFLPYKKRLKALGMLSPELNSLALIAENDWYRVSKGHLTEPEIHELQMKLKKKKHEAVVKSFGASSLPEAKDLIERACKDCESYVASYFGAPNG